MNLRFENLKRCYGDRLVLDLGHGQINCGRITGIIGLQGAGKSTFINIIAGADKPSSGRIMYGYLDNRSNKLFAEELPRDKMALLSQQGYKLHATVEKNIAHHLKQRKLPKEQIRARVVELMNNLELTSLARRRGWQLSEAERQKATVAKTLAPHPELLLMDEPDYDIKDATIASIERVILKENAEHGLTMVLVSNNLAQVRRLCHELIFMHQGRILEQGQTEELLNNPHRPETKDFIENHLAT